MNYATKPQIAKIHILLNQLGIMDDKKQIVKNFSSGRTESSRELSFEEAKSLIRNLAEYDPSERLKTIIFSLGYQAGILYGCSMDDKRMNAAKLNLFLKERGAVKKDLNTMTYPELIKTHRQFEAILKNTKKNNDNKQAGKIVSSLLEELNLSTL